MEKKVDSCSDIEILWDISFGAYFEFEIEISCLGDGICKNSIVKYDKEISFKKKGEKEKTLLEHSSAYYNCNNLINPTKILNTELGDTTGVNYEINDTIIFDFFNPKFCRSSYFRDCRDISEPIDLPNFTFEYVLKNEDFDCD